MILVGPLFALVALACQERTSRTEESAGTAPDAAPAMQNASADTPPASPVDTDTSAGSPLGAESAKAADTGTAAGAGQPSAQATGEEQTGEAGGGQEAAAGEGSGDIVNGWKQYEANCARCHGQDALGSAIAPDLRASVKGAVDHGAFVQTVMNGRPAKGMPAFAQQLEEKQVEDLYAYVTARSSGKLGPGRPGG